MKEIIHRNQDMARGFVRMGGTRRPYKEKKKGSTRSGQYQWGAGALFGGNFKHETGAVGGLGVVNSLLARDVKRQDTWYAQGKRKRGYWLEATECDK